MEIISKGALVIAEKRALGRSNKKEEDMYAKGYY